MSFFLHWLVILLSFLPTIHSFISIGQSLQQHQQRQHQRQIQDYYQHDSSTTALPMSSRRTGHVDTIICGGGPTGLLSAIMLARKYPMQKIHVYDKLPKPPSPTDETVWGNVGKYYLIGLGGRGITALKEYGAWKDAESVCIPLVARIDWTPGSPPEGVLMENKDRNYITQCLPRDKLVAVLHQHVTEKYSDRVTIFHDRRVEPISFGSKNNMDYPVVVDIVSERSETVLQTVSTDLLLATEGSARTIASAIERESTKSNKNNDVDLDVDSTGTNDSFSIIRFENDNERVYKTMPFTLPQDGTWAYDYNYSVRSKNSRITFDALPANNCGDYCGVLLMSASDEMANANVNVNTFNRFLKEVIPQFYDMIEPDVIATAAAQPASKLPGFRYVTPRLHHGYRTVLLGDCAHTVKPYFGMGANSALEDVKIFGDCIDKTPGRNITTAIQRYSKERAPEVEALVKISHGLDRPGVEGVFAFLIPVIMDAIFHKLSPQIFAPNIIRMLQNEELSFTEAAFRKRMDRILQLILLSTGFGATGFVLFNVYGLLFGMS